MPLHANQSTLFERIPQYFSTLQELDSWTESNSNKLDGILPYIPRSTNSEEGHKGNLLVCHDYKGGYHEKLDGISYTFNFWSLCDIFIYFSHYRVTIPPPGWINAAHRNGVKMLGTLIFEHQASEEDALRLVLGPIQFSTSGSPPNPTPTLPLSSHYATSLAHLAHERGFDGYLLNIECPLRGSFEQVRNLLVWISLLNRELKKWVGDWAECIWYDSVIINGALRWQDRLNNLNLPFFIQSTAFFTNYTWRPDYPAQTAEYFFSLDPSTLMSPTHPPKSLNTIHVGIDVWGRNQHGSGGFGVFKALQHIDPQFLGLSVALFGQGWSWETTEDWDGWQRDAVGGWEKWWAYDRLLWFGSTGEDGEAEDEGVELIVPPPKEDERGCSHGTFEPIQKFFDTKHPPDPIFHAFWTSFGVGVGRSWWVNGERVFESKTGGWTDVDKSGSIGDLCWPRPVLRWINQEEGKQEESSVPKAKAKISLDDAWLGGSSLQVSFPLPRISTSSDSSEGDGDIEFKCTFLPIQSLSATPGIIYQVDFVTKTGVQCDVDVGATVKWIEPSFSTSDEDKPEKWEIIVASAGQAELSYGWIKISVTFVAKPLHRPTSSSSTKVKVAIGLVLGFLVLPDTEGFVDISIGSLAVYPTHEDDTADIKEHLMNATFHPYLPQNEPTNSPRAHFQNGYLQWIPTTYFKEKIATLPQFTDPNDPTSAYAFPLPQPDLSISLRFAYFNIFASLSTAGEEGHKKVWLGTTGLEGYQNRFWVDGELLRNAGIIEPTVKTVSVEEDIREIVKTSSDDAQTVMESNTTVIRQEYSHQSDGKVRLWVQGVTAKGEVMGWDSSVWLEVQL
ncbi:glycosyl hydrolase family 85-domain-containing protein [Abortiporus biennis]|nr:glycosyl hydrolase family 85-domain-containing protein [Abortiporus biennis]